MRCDAAWRCCGVAVAVALLEEMLLERTGPEGPEGWLSWRREGPGRQLRVSASPTGRVLRGWTQGARAEAGLSDSLCLDNDRMTGRAQASTQHVGGVDAVQCSAAQLEMDAQAGRAENKLRV